MYFHRDFRVERLKGNLLQEPNTALTAPSENDGILPMVAETPLANYAKRITILLHEQKKVPYYQ